MATIGNYVILREIAEGGMGRIYQAQHVLNGKNACIKQNKEASTLDVELLKSESGIIWDFDHPSIPHAKDLIKISDLEYALVMQYIQGETVYNLVNHNGRLHPEDASRVTERLLGALYYAHYHGVIHGDVKPQNVIVETYRTELNIKLVDWGLSIIRPTHATKLKGYTPAYVAPEIPLGKPPIPETDLYGVGIVLLYALGGNVEKKTIPRDVPTELSDFCNSLLLYDPGERPNWDKENPIEKLSDIRQRVFGRRHVA